MPADVRELRKLARDLRKAESKITKLVQNAVIKTAADIEADAKRRAPVDTGALRNSIGREYSADYLSAEVGPTVNYAMFVEFGTSRTAPQPFMGPAADRYLPRFEKAIEKITERIL